MPRSRNPAGLLLFSCVAVGCADLALAQQPVEEIIVTVRKRAESLQDVPIAVSAIGADLIERQGINDLIGISKLDPSVQFDTGFGPQDTRVTIRGLSNTRGRSNVAFLVDGIDVTTENAITAGSGLLANKRLLNDVERIEIVKGPQSALYGRAAFAGAISYVTKEPGDEFEAQLRVDAGDYGRWQLDGAISGPVVENLFALRLSGVYWSEDGFYQNSVSGNDVGGGEGFGAALTAVWTPTESIKIRPRLEYSEDEYRPSATARIDGVAPVIYPQEALDAGVGISDAFGGTATSLPDFGVYCPGLLPLQASTAEVLALFPNHPLVPDPDNPGQQIPAPGFCWPDSYGSAAGTPITQGEDPLTGEDYAGDTVDVFRASLIATWEPGDFVVTSYTGFTDADFSQAFDQDYQAIGRPDQITSALWTTTTQNTMQFSQELRLATLWDSPLQITVGGLYWNEERELTDSSGIISCAPVTKDFSGNLVTNVPGVCDGTSSGGALTSVSSVQEYARQNLRPQVPGFLGAVWLTETEHLSAYLNLEWDINDQLTLSFENRYVDETFDITRPNQASCGQLGFAVLGGGLVSPLASQAANPGALIACVAWDSAIRKVNSGQDPNFDIWVGATLPGQDWALIQGTEKSDFHTPKVTLEWRATDDALFYSYVARAQKPGGIGQLEAGQAATTIEEQRFEPEKMTAYEIGYKGTWRLGGFLQTNLAGFFQDYTDKQTVTQELINNALAPRVTNASAAEVLGLEVDVTWRPDFLEGLTLSGAYTYLDATYKKFDDDTAILLRAAQTGQCQVLYKGGEGPNPGDFNDPANGGPTCRIDQSGNRLERTPEHAFRGLAAVQRQVPGQDYDWLVELNAVYHGERFLDADNYVKFDDYWLFDLRAGLTGERFDFIAYVENLFDDDTLKTGGAGPDFGSQAAELGFVAGLGLQQVFGTLPAPRVFGLRLALRF
ncbi:MAG: TonB-dependent receptor [Gammaproteobacteria bacterium]|nr:TonB-dependent receptor [Gammaproteobacteria bacterium]